MSRTKGAKNKNPTRERYIYVRMTADLYDWVLAHEGRSESDTVVQLLELLRFDEQTQKNVKRLAEKGRRQ